MADDDKTPTPPRRAAPLPGVPKAPAKASPLHLLEKLHAECGRHSAGALRAKLTEVITLLKAG